MKTPTEIISETLREGDVRPTLGALRMDVAETDAIVGYLDQEIQKLREALGPILVPGPADPPPMEKACATEVPEPVRCSLSADIHGVQKSLWELQARLRGLTNWVSTIHSEVRL